jgi:hypothetical protein
MKKWYAVLAITSALSACSMVPEFALPEAANPPAWNGMQTSADATAVADVDWATL